MGKAPCAGELQAPVLIRREAREARDTEDGSKRPRLSSRRSAVTPGAGRGRRNTQGLGACSLSSVKVVRIPDGRKARYELHALARERERERGGERERESERGCCLDRRVLESGGGGGFWGRTGQGEDFRGCWSQAPSSWRLGRGGDASVERAQPLSL